MRKIAIDMDGVMADVEAQFLIWYEKDYGQKFTKEHLVGVPEFDAFPDKNAVRRFVNSPGFFRTIPVMDGAVPAVQKLMEKYEIYVVSAALEFPLSLAEKHEWLREHFPFISWRNIVFCGDKSIIDTDYMVDDHCKNLDHCKGRTLMFSSGHNANDTHHKRAANWQQVLAYFEAEEKL